MDLMVRTHVAPALGTNCYLVGMSDRNDAVLVDAGIAEGRALAAFVRDSGRELAGIVLTHGHLDHTESAAAVQAELGPVPVWLHPDDHPRLVDPWADLGTDLAQALRSALGDLPWHPPTNVRALTTEVTELAGMACQVFHAPGHTQGSVVVRLRDPRSDVPATCLSGDVVFAGSVGRTDLPGGDPRAMETTLRTVIPQLGDGDRLLPGHGPATTVARERATNPWLHR